MPHAQLDSILNWLVCPVGRRPLERAGDELVCGCGLRYPIKDGIPALVEDAAQWPAGAARENLPCLVDRRTKTVTPANHAG